MRRGGLKKLYALWLATSIEGKLDVLRVECTKCDRKGRYSVATQGKSDVWREMLNADCPRRDARIHDRCDLVCPGLPTVL